MRTGIRTSTAALGWVAVLTLGVLAQTPTERKLEISFPADGLVTLVAQNVTLREIFAEWTRQTGAAFTNAEKLAGEPQTVQYENQPEAAVIDSLLRSAAGYFVAPQRGGPVMSSRIAMVYIIPTSRGTASTGFSSSPATAFAPPVLTPGNPNDEISPVTPATEPGQTASPQPEPNRPTYLGPGIVPITPVNSGGRGGGPGGAGGTSPPPTPPPGSTGS
jgi:hypothetical protein